jgi:hypothetical protein
VLSQQGDDYMHRSTIRSAACCGCIAAVLASGAAFAGKPTDQDKQAKAAAVAANSRALPQPRTMAEAEATQARLPDGTVMVMVPTELWSHLSVERAADGTLRMVEREGTHAPAAAKEASHD